MCGIGTLFGVCGQRPLSFVAEVPQPSLPDRRAQPLNDGGGHLLVSVGRFDRAARLLGSSVEQPRKRVADLILRSPRVGDSLLLRV